MENGSTFQLRKYSNWFSGFIEEMLETFKASSYDLISVEISAESVCVCFESKLQCTMLSKVNIAHVLIQNDNVYKIITKYI